MDIAFWVSLGIFVVVLSVSLMVALGYRKIKRLEDVIPYDAEFPPKVSIIVPALNEEDTIEPALLSMLDIDYPNLEIIAINDRSTDSTPHILDKLAANNSLLRVLHIHELPAGWLGKNHALYQAAQVANGDYIIFTDADIIFEKSTVARAVAYCEQNKVDHLTLLFNLIAKTYLLKMMLVNFTIALFARFKPWKLESSPKHFMGIGGFNMVKRSSYLQAGGHAEIALAVLDDIILGKLMKTNGFVQHALSALELVSVEWYRNTPEMIRGLRKNIFAAFNFQVSKLVFASVMMLLLRVWPWIGIFCTNGFTQWLNIATLLIGFSLYANILHVYHWRYRTLLFAPLCGFIEIFMWWRGSLLVMWRGGIEWRGTFYSIVELKKNKFPL